MSFPARLATVDFTALLHTRAARVLGAIACAVLVGGGVVLLLPETIDSLLQLGVSLLGRSLRQPGKWRWMVQAHGAYAIVCGGLVAAALVWPHWARERLQALTLPEEATGSSRWAAAVLAIYATVTLLLVATHEPWGDEIHAWMISAMSPADIIYEMRLEGHFALWYLLLHPLAANKAPLITLNIVSWAVMVGAAWLVLRHAPFGKVLRLLVVFSAAMIFWYPVVSRCYALIPPLLLLLVYLYPQRTRLPIVFGFTFALLANTHIYVYGIIAALWPLFAYDVVIARWKAISLRERVASVGGVVIAFVGPLAAFLQVYQALGQSSVPRIDVTSMSAIGFIRHSLFELYLIPRASWVLPAMLPAFAVVLGMFLVRMLQAHRRSGLLLGVGLAWQALFAIFVYSGGVPQRASLWLVFGAAALWLAYHELASGSPDVNRRRLTGAALAYAFLVVTTAYGYIVPARDVTQRFSGRVETAAFVRSSIPPGTVLLVVPYGMVTATFAAYLEGYDLVGYGDLRLVTGYHNEHGIRHLSSLDHVFSHSLMEGPLSVIARAAYLPQLEESAQDDYTMTHVFASYPSFKAAPLSEDFVLVNVMPAPRSRLQRVGVVRSTHELWPSLGWAAERRCPHGEGDPGE